MTTEPMTEAPQLKSKWKSGCLIAIGIFVAIGVIGTIFGDDTAKDAASGTTATPTTPAEPATKAEPAAPANAPTISKAEFLEIKNGMTIDEVNEIVGGPGEVLSESEVAGYKGAMYKYEGEGGFGANANVQTQNGKVISKAQFGLE